MCRSDIVVAEHGIYPEGVILSFCIPLRPGCCFCASSPSTTSRNLLILYYSPLLSAPSSPSQGYRWDLTDSEAQELGRRAIVAAGHRDAYSGNTNNLYHVRENGWEFLGKYPRLRRCLPSLVIRGASQYNTHFLRQSAVHHYRQQGHLRTMVRIRRTEETSLAGIYRCRTSSCSSGGGTECFGGGCGWWWRCGDEGVENGREWIGDVDAVLWLCCMITDCMLESISAKCDVSLTRVFGRLVSFGHSTSSHEPTPTVHFIICLSAICIPPPSHHVEIFL